MAIIPELATVGKSMRLLKCQPIVNHPQKSVKLAVKSSYVSTADMTTNLRINRMSAVARQVLNRLSRINW
jgi:predicted transposase YbfD/YdcC